MRDPEIDESVLSESRKHPRLLGPAIVANAAGTTVLLYQLDAELQARLRDAVKPLGFTVKRAPGHRVLGARAPEWRHVRRDMVCRGAESSPYI